MKNTFSNSNNERVRVVSKTRTVSELQESKSYLATTINKKIKEANSFATGASESKIVDASQSRKKAVVVNQKTSNQPSESASWSKRGITILQERTGELEM